MNSFLKTSIETLCAKSSVLSELEIQENLQNILEHVLMQQVPLQKRIASISKVKTSTKQEIYKRLHWTLEYINDNFTSPLTINQLADHACLSVFYFKRVFKEVYQIPPYQYVKSRRMERAKELLKMGYGVQAACRASGWEDTSSFIRLFRQTTSLTPKKFKLLGSDVG